MPVNDYGVWSDRLNTFTKYNTNIPAVEKANSGIDVKASGNTSLIRNDKPKEEPKPQPGAWAVPGTKTNDVVKNQTYFKGRNYKFTPTKPAEGQDFWSAVGDILSIPLRLGTSLLLTLGTGAQAVRHLVNAGPEFSWDKQNEWLGKQLEKSWTDPWATSMIFNNDGFLVEKEKEHADLGTALTFGLGQTTALATDLVVSGVTGGQTFSGSWDKQLSNQEAIQTFSWMSKNWGISFGELQFDPFSVGQRATVTGAEYNADGTLKLDETGRPITGSGWTAGNVMTQFVGNFIGGLALDPLSYIPMSWVGKVGKVLFSGRFLTGVGEKTVAKNLATDMTQWSGIAGLGDSGLNASGRYLSKEAAEAAAGQKLDYWNFAKFAAENNADVISQHVVIKSITSGEKENIAWLLGQATSEQEVAKIFLATEYGSQRAFQDLVSSRPNLKLALDEFIDGGYLVRGERDGSLSSITMLDSMEHPEFLKSVVEASDLLAKDEFSTVLSNLVVKSGPNGLAGNTVLRELMPSKFGLVNKFEGGKARIGSFFVHGKTYDGSVRVERSFGNGTNWLYHQVVRPFQTSAKGMIDLEDPIGDASRKFFGMLGDIDRLSGSALTTGGYKTALSNAWRMATTPDAKAKVLQNAQELGLTLIATKQGFNKDTAAALSATLMENKRIFTENLQRNGVVVMKFGNEKIVYNDPFMVNQTPNKINIWDFSKVRDEMIKAKPQILADAPIRYNAARTAVIFKNGVSSFYNSIGAMFQSIVLLRAGRTARDMFQNGVSSLLSGYGGAMLKNAINPALLLNAVENSASRMIAREMRMNLALRGYASPQKIEQAIKSLDDLNMALLEQEGIRLRKIVQDVANQKIEDIPYEDIPRFLASAHELTAVPHYHVTFDRQAFMNEQINGFSDRSIATFNNQEDTLDYIGKLGTDINTAKATDSLTLPDSVGKRITKDARTKVEDAISNGDIVHVRVAGRGRKWQLLDAKKFRSQTDADIAKYEIRVVSPKAAGGTTKQDLLDAIDRGDSVWASRGGEKYKPLTRPEIEAITDVSAISGKIFPKGKVPKVVEVKSYGKEVHLGSFKDLPEELAKHLKIKNQKELDAWIANRGYDKLTFFDLVKMSDQKVGRFTVTQDGKTISIINPLSADATGKEINQALIIAVIRDLEAAGVDWTGMGFLAGSAALRDKLVETGWLTATKEGAKPVTADELTKMTLGQLTNAGMFSRTLVNRLGKNAQAKLDELDRSTLPINSKLANLYGVGDNELLPAILAVKQNLTNNIEQMEVLGQSLIKSRSEWDKLNAIKANRKHFETDGTVRIGREDFAQSLAGIEGDIFLGKLAKSVEDVRLRDSLWKPMDAQLVTRVVKPNEVGYWDAWANVLNRNFMHDGKLDPVVRLVLENRLKGVVEEEDLVVVIKDWLKTAEGKKYADAVGVGKKYSVVGPGTEQFIRPDKVRFEQLSEDDFAIMNIRNVDNHVGYMGPDAPFITLEEAKGYIKNLKSMGFDVGDLTPEKWLAEIETAKNLVAKKLLDGEEITATELQAYHLGRFPSGPSVGERIPNVDMSGRYGELGLPDIWASIADPSERTLTQRLGREALNKWNKMITDYPQQVFFQMPMFHVAYRESLERQMLQKATAKGIGIDDVRVTEGERLNIVRNARQYALNQTKKWIYSYTDGMEIRQALAAVVPFGNAFLFSMKSLVNGARYNPASTALMIYWANKLNNNTHWVDKNGNPVGFDEKDENGERKAAYVQASLPEWFTNSLAGGEVKKILFNRQSLDPVFQGNYQDIGSSSFAIPNPLQSFSLMPIPTIALSELLKQEAKQGGEGPVTTFAQWANRVLPFGPSSEQWSWDLLVPGNLAKATIDSLDTWWGGEGKGVWTRSYLNSVQYVNGQYLLGKYPEIDALPTQAQKDKALLQKAKEYTGAIFYLKMASDFFSPVATQYLTPGDIARKAYKSYKDKAQAEFDAGGTNYQERLKVWEDKYGRGYTVNDMALYNTMYENEEWWAASISPTFNQYGIEYNTDSLARLERNKGLIKSVQDYATVVGMNDGDIRDVLSWIVNDGRRNPGAAFDENSYAALQSEYLNPRTPAEYSTYIRIQRGWYSYNNGYTVPAPNGKGEKLPGIKWLQNNLMIPTTNPSDTAEIKPFYYEGRYISGTYGYWKNKLTNALYNDPQFGAAWQSDKKKAIDPNKFNDLAGVWQSIIWNGYGSDGKPLPGNTKVETQLDKDIATFLIARYNRQKELRERGQLTGRGTLAQNPDIRDAWYNDLEPLLNGSNPDFEDWYYNFRWNEDSLN